MNVHRVNSGDLRENAGKREITYLLFHIWFSFVSEYLNSGRIIGF